MRTLTLEELAEVSKLAAEYGSEIGTKRKKHEITGCEVVRRLDDGLVVLMRVKVYYPREVKCPLDDIDPLLCCDEEAEC
jgi:hypothetical protein